MEYKMGLFSNPKCPRCGRESVLATALDGDYYTCPPCNRTARKEKEEKKAIEERVTKLERILKEVKDDSNTN